MRSRRIQQRLGLPGYPTLSRAAALVCLLLTAAALTGCQERIETDGRDLGSDGLPAIPHPVVERDLPQIGDSGTLRMVTSYNSSTYFVHRGGQAGFDYELLERFARRHGLHMEVVIPESEQDPVSLLNAGRGDVLCPGQSPDPHHARWLSHTVPTNFVQKVLVVAGADSQRTHVADLAGLVLTLPRNDPFRTELQQMRADSGVAFFISMAPEDVEPEELLARVSRGELAAVVVDDVVARAAMAYLPDLRIAQPLNDRQPTMWYVRQNSPELLAALDAFLRKHLKVAANGRTRRSQVYGIIYDRYFENAKTIKGFRKAAHRPDKSGRISKYDDLIRRYAEAAGLDWRMVAALIYQESRFYPFALSKAGAKGLMQVLPQFAGDDADSLFYPEPNIRAGLRLMTATYNSYAYLDSLDRWRFTLAEYHAGNGHVSDARRLAMDRGRDPNQWEDSLSETLPLLMQRKYFANTRHGFYRGAETVEYVEEILSRYRMYTRLVPRDPSALPDSVAIDLPTGQEADLTTLPDLIDGQPPPPR